MILVPCKEKDLAQIIDFYEGVVRYLEEHVNYPRWSADHPSRESLEEAVRKGEQYAFFENGKILGAVILNEDPEGAYEAGDWLQDLKRGEALIVHVLAVEPRAARRGIGGRLVDGCAELARQKKYKALRLDTLPGNEPAIRLYEKKGFHYAGTKDLLRNIKGLKDFRLYELPL